MKTLDKEQFLTADDLPLSPVSLPKSYGDDVGFYVRMMTGTERSAMEKKYFSDGKDPKDDPGAFRVGIVTTCIVDETGKHIFTMADAERLMGKAGDTIETMFTAACELNGFMKDDVETLEKN